MNLRPPGPEPEPSKIDRFSVISESGRPREFNGIVEICCFRYILEALSATNSTPVVIGDGIPTPPNPTSIHPVARTTQFVTIVSRFGWISGLGRRHLKRLINEYVRYHHDDRTPLGLGGRTLARRAVEKEAQSMRRWLLAETRGSASPLCHSDLALRGSECRIRYRNAFCADLERSSLGKARQRSLATWCEIRSGKGKAIWIAGRIEALSTEPAGPQPGETSSSQFTARALSFRGRNQPRR